MSMSLTIPTAERIELEAPVQAGSATRGPSGVVDRRGWDGLGFASEENVINPGLGVGNAGRREGGPNLSEFIELRWPVWFGRR